jgi:hypothetical protein
VYTNPVRNTKKMNIPKKDVSCARNAEIVLRIVTKNGTNERKNTSFLLSFESLIDFFIESETDFFSIITTG